MITKYSLQVTYDKLLVEHERISNRIPKLPVGTSIRNNLVANRNNLQGRMEMLQELVKEAED